jgi:biopolymer transport protein ExbB/TolQ
MSNANYKKWLYTGAAIFTGSSVAGVLGTLWGVFSSFDALKTNESAGIGAVGGGIEKALFFTVFFLITGLAGFVILIIGIFKMRRFKSPKAR